MLMVTCQAWEEEKMRDGIRGIGRIKKIMLLVSAGFLFISSSLFAGFSLKYNSPPNTNGIDTTVITFINGALSKLDVAIFQMGHTGIRDALINAKNRGVAVRVVTEASNWGADMNSLVAAGIPVVKDTDGGAGSGLMHNKFAIRDGNAVLTGSYNWTLTQATNDKNSLIILTNASALASIFTTEFNKMFVNKAFGTQKTETTTKSAYVDGYLVEAHFSPKGNVTAKITTQIYNCNSTFIFNMFTFTDSGIATALKHKKAQGKNVKGSFDRWQADSSFSQDESLAAGGVLVRRDTYTGLLHDKTAAIDRGTTSDPVGIIGSFNWTVSANDTNDENLLIIHNPTVANSIGGNCSYVYTYKAN